VSLTICWRARGHGRARGRAGPPSALLLTRPRNQGAGARTKLREEAEHSQSYFAYMRASGVQAKG
jgi:hypothetical protein